MISWSRIHSLQQEFGAEDFQDILEVFLEEVDEALAGIDRNASPEAMGEVLHFLKGSALNLGFRDFADLCQIGESELKQKASTKVDMHALADVYGRSRTALVSGLNDPVRQAG